MQAWAVHPCPIGHQNQRLDKVHNECCAELKTHCTLLEADHLGEYACVSSCLLFATTDGMQWCTPSMPTLTSSLQYAVYCTQWPTSWTNGAPIIVCTMPWSCTCQDAAIACGSHLSAHLHLPFLEHKMLTMVCKGQWMVLPYKAVADIPNLHLSPLGVIPQCKH